jgi:hypothetical protein
MSRRRLLLFLIALALTVGGASWWSSFNRLSLLEQRLLGRWWASQPPSDQLPQGSTHFRDYYADGTSRSMTFMWRAGPADIVPDWQSGGPVDYWRVQDGDLILELDSHRLDLVRRGLSRGPADAVRAAVYKVRTFRWAVESVTDEELILRADTGQPWRLTRKPPN